MGVTVSKRANTAPSSVALVKHSQFLTDIKSLSEQLDQTELDCNISISTLLYSRKTLVSSSLLRNRPHKPPLIERETDGDQILYGSSGVNGQVLSGSRRVGGDLDTLELNSIRWFSCTQCSEHGGETEGMEKTSADPFFAPRALCLARLQER